MFYDFDPYMCYDFFKIKRIRVFFVQINLIQKI